MKRRAFLQTAAGASLAASCRSVRKTERRPNVVMVLTDDQRWDDLSCAGHPFLKTPNLDRLAAEGVRFSNAFVTTSLCSPSRASYLSGLYAHTHGVINNFTEYPPQLPSYPRALHEAGYRTAYIGKWHMGEDNDQPRPGFDYWASHRGQGKYYDTEFNINGKRQMLQGYYTHRVTELATNWLKKESARPFLMILGHKAPHGVWIPEKKYETVFDNLPMNPPRSAPIDSGKPSWVRDRIRTWHGIEGPLYGTRDFGKFMRTYHATILSVDDSVGELYATLRAIGELDNTVIVFASDNGFLLGEHGSIDKRTMWEESIRVPLLVRYPGLAPSPKVVDRMVLNVDLAPSLLETCGLPAPPKVHGRSWKKLVQGGDPDWRKAWYYEYNFESEFPYTPNVRGVRTDQWKYLHYPNGEGQRDTYKAELYNLEQDPLEMKNLIDAPEAKEMLASLRSTMANLQAETGALPDRMPVNPKLRMEDPLQSIR